MHSTLSTKHLLMRTIKKIHQAEYRPIADLITYSPLPTRTLSQVDPFIFLNHHGFQHYPANNRGLPFGPHPHRGMETVTFIIEGDIMHKDSSGHESIIYGGGVQWMTAGSGLIHAEVSSEQFKKEGGDLEILQLWLNLPAKLKMTKPFYLGLQKDEIPTISLANDAIQVNLISGKWGEKAGAFESKTDVFLSTIAFKANAELNVDVAKESNIFFYIIRGAMTVNGKNVEARQLVEFQNDAESINIKTESDSLIIFGHAVPFNEPMVAQGPFVMNTQEEIYQAYIDYQQGKFGTWQ